MTDKLSLAALLRDILGERLDEYLDECGVTRADFDAHRFTIVVTDDGRKIGPLQRNEDHER